ncbi:uncharacterized protein LOC144099026 [Amblyomma americanum]
MPVMCTLILDLMLVTSLVGVSMARRPQIAMEELSKKSASTHSEVDANGGGGQPAPLKPAAVSSCYFNRDCKPREMCVKPEGSGALTTGVCSLRSSEVKPARASEHGLDLHYVVRNRVRRSAAASGPRRRNDLLRQLLGEGSQLSRALNAYVHAKYPTEWENAKTDIKQERTGKDSASANLDPTGGTADPDLLAILDVAHNRILESSSQYEMSGASGEVKAAPEVGGKHGAASSSQAPVKVDDAVVDVKEDDMASGPKRRRMTEPTNYL